MQTQHLAASSDNAEASQLAGASSAESRNESPTPAAATAATETVAASAGIGTRSPVIPESWLRTSALHQCRSHVLVSHDFFLVMCPLFIYLIPQCRRIIDSKMSGRPADLRFFL